MALKTCVSGKRESRGDEFFTFFLSVFNYTLHSAELFILYTHGIDLEYTYIHLSELACLGSGSCFNHRQALSVNAFIRIKQTLYSHDILSVFLCCDLASLSLWDR